MYRFAVLRSLAIGSALALGTNAVAAPAAAAPADPKAPATASPSPGDPPKPSNPTATPTPTTKATSKAPAPGQTKDYSASALGVELKAKGFTLDNGLEVYVVEDHSTPAFALMIGVDVGSRDEPEGRTGFAHFFEHMMFKGSKNVPEGGHFKYVLGGGGELNAFTAPDFTGYFEVAPSHFLDRVLWLEADRFASLEIIDDNVNNQRQAVKEEKALRFENAPYAGALVEFFASLWQGTGYGHSAIGSEADLDAAKTADFQAFFDKYYVPNNMVMTIVGDVEFEDVRTKVTNYFGPLKPGPEREPFGTVTIEQEKLEKVVEDKLAQQPMFLFGWKTVASHHPDRPALDLLMSILLEGESSRVSRILKDEKKMIVASIPLPASASGGRETGAALAGFIPVEGVNLEDIKKVVLDEVAGVKKKGVSRKELQKAINQNLVGKVSTLATNQGRAMTIAIGAMTEGDPMYILADLERYKKVTPKDIARVANQYLTDQWVSLAIVPATKGPMPAMKQ